MPGGSAVSGGNELFDILMYITITPPTVTSGTQSAATTVVPGLAVGDFISWNMLTLPNALISVTNMYASAANTLTSLWSSEGSTVSGAAPQPFLIEVVRANIVPYTALPNAIE